MPKSCICHEHRCECDCCECDCQDNQAVGSTTTVTGAVLRLLMAGVLIAAIIAWFVGGAVARDDGRYAASPLKPWFDTLKNKSGTLCCSDADGTALSDVDWDTKNGKYRVRIEGEWLVVPDEAVIEEPNRAGRAMVWPVRGANMGLSIRCFIRGATG